MVLSMEAEIIAFIQSLTPEAVGVAESYTYVIIKSKLDCSIAPTSTAGIANGLKTPYSIRELDGTHSIKSYQ